MLNKDVTLMANNIGEIIGFHLPTEPHGCFSNWHPSDFTYAGVRYNCAEQYMMAQKVMLGNRPDLRDRIMKASDPAEIKALGGKDAFPEFASIKPLWDRHCRHIVKRGVKAKFRQNPEMLQELLDTGHALLCECAGHDRIWGIGINLHDDRWHNVEEWNGNNYLGIALMEVREELRRELREGGTVQYIDYREAAPIPEWNTTADYLKRIPQYYNAVHTYLDQIPMGNLREAFFSKPLSRHEQMMKSSPDYSFPEAGFYEMKQDIYEIARSLGEN